MSTEKPAPMSAEEMAAFRAWLDRRGPYNPNDDDYLPTKMTSLYSLDATLDARDARIAELERERDRVQETLKDVLPRIVRLESIEAAARLGEEALHNALLSVPRRDAVQEAIHVIGEYALKALRDALEGR